LNPNPSNLVNPFDSLIDAAIVVSVVMFIASLVYAYRLRTGALAGSLSDSQVRARGYLVIGLWVILPPIPPIWFFFEFQFLHPNMLRDAVEMGRVRHAQDLGRNVWIAFVIVLAAVVGVKWPPGS
jgi:hypothetical protein